jgi:CheY-like chemotaxis protein
VIFLAEDDDELRGLLADQLRADGHQVVEARDADQLERAMDARHATQPPPADEVVICDLLMPGRTGLQVLDACRERGSCPPFILMTGFADDDLREEALEHGALAVIDKPMALDAIRRLLRGSVEALL